MKTHSSDIKQVCKKLKKIRGDVSKSIEIPFIETLCGKYTSENILEGFYAKTEMLCNIYSHCDICDMSLSLIIVTNSIIDHLNYLSSPQLNTAVATIVYKGKRKSVYSHKSYRQVRVTPLIGRLIDEYLRPVKIS